jgi:hypothetical protein
MCRRVGAKPQVGADEADAVVAFFDSAAHASNAPGTDEKSPVFHVEAIGTATVQGTSLLAEAVIKDAKSGADARSAFKETLKKISGCVQPS